MNKSNPAPHRSSVRAVLCLGGNLGDRRGYLKKAAELISERAGSIFASSVFYETQGWNTRSDRWFLNQVVGIETRLAPEVLLSTVLTIENELGRTRDLVQNSDRVIDIDVLFYNNSVIKGHGIEVPHPRLHLRRFVLLPLSEILPDQLHPVFKKTAAELLRECPDTLEVRPALPES